MFKYIAIGLAAMLIAQPVLAAEGAGAAEKPCAPIVKACLDAGYTRHGSQGKQFWKDCMKPLLLGGSVANVTVDPKDVSACRAVKINQMQQESTELKNVN